MKHSAPAACAALLVLASACSVGVKTEPPATHPKKFPAPLFDGLWLGMPRDDAARAHPMRPTLTTAGRSRRVWVYDRSGEYSVELTFPDGRPDAKLERFDVHFGSNEMVSQRMIGELARTLGDPDVPRRKAMTNAYGDHLHDQYDTVWSDADQYVYVTERTPIAGRRGQTDRLISVKRKELVPK